MWILKRLFLICSEEEERGRSDVGGEEERGWFDGRRGLDDNLCLVRLMVLKNPPGGMRGGDK